MNERDPLNEKRSSSEERSAMTETMLLLHAARLPHQLSGNEKKSSYAATSETLGLELTMI